MIKPSSSRYTRSKKVAGRVTDLESGKSKSAKEISRGIAESGYFPTKQSQREDEKKYNLSKDRLPGEHKPRKPQKPGM